MSVDSGSHTSQLEVKGQAHCWVCYLCHVKTDFTGNVWVSSSVGLPCYGQVKLAL